MLNLWKIRSDKGGIHTRPAHLSRGYLYISLSTKRWVTRPVFDGRVLLIKTLYYRNFNIYVGQGLNDLDDSWDVKGV